MSKQENEHRCPSMYRIGYEAGTIIQCDYWRGHGEHGTTAHVSDCGHMWFDANEYHEPPSEPKCPWPWRVIDKDGYARSAALTRYEAEAKCPEGSRVMRLVDPDAVVIQEPVDVAALEATLAAVVSIEDVVRALNLPIKEDDDG